MTVSTTSARVAYAGNGSTTAFTVPWLFLSNADLQVRKRSSSGTESTLAVGTDYTVAGALSPSGGTVTLLAPPATGETVVIIRDPIIIQSTDYLPNDPFPAESHERALDLLTMIAQRLDDRLDRALVLAESDTPGAGAFQGGGNRITNLAPGTQSSDAVTLLQVQSLISSSGGGGGGTSGGGGSVVVPDSEIDRIIALTVIDPSLTSLFDPLNASVGNLASQILGLNDSVGSINTSVGTITVRLVDLQSQIDALSVISGDANNIITLLATETTNRIAGDTAIVAVLDKMGAADGDNVSFLLNLDTVKVGPTETLSARLSSITSQFGTVSANVTAEATARAASDTAISQTIAKLGALNGAGTAFVFDLNTAYVGASESLGQRLSGIATSVNANAAAILSEQSTRANADSALSTTLTTLQTTVNGHTTTISTQATTINGIQAKYAVKVDNNGYVSGFGLISTANNGTVTSTFNILADAFKVYNGTTAVEVFSVAGGIVSMQNVKIGSAVIDDLAVGTINIANNAVTSTQIGDASNSGATVNVAVGGTYYDIPSVSVTPTGIPTTNARVLVRAMFNAEAQGASAETITLRLRRSDGTTFSGPDIRLRTSGPEVYTWEFVDSSPAAASYTYQLQLTSGSSGNRGKFYESRIIATVLKK